MNVLAPSKTAPERPARREHGTPARRVLFITYQFPPVGGAGVQRVAKFVKYLPHFGWQPSILTVSNPSVPVFDESLLTDIPRDVPVYKAATLEPSYSLKSGLLAPSGQGSALGCARRLGKSVLNSLLQPDPQVLWLPGATAAGLRLLRACPHAAIVASGPPFSTFLAGALLGKMTGLPLVLDYRDEWDLSTIYLENRHRSRLTGWLQQKMQAFAQRQARVLIATTRGSALALDALRKTAGSQAFVTAIYNGYDPEDFPEVAPGPTRALARYRLVYVGTLWNLTDIEPLVQAIRALCADRPDLAARLELLLLGRRTEPQERCLAQLRDGPCRVTAHSYVEHGRALEALRSADALCLLLADLPGARRVVPAKLFEYLASGRPILTIAPKGEVWHILENYPRATCIEPGERPAIVNFLVDQLQRPLRCLPYFPATLVSRYSRKELSGELARCLESLV